MCSPMGWIAETEASSRRERQPSRPYAESPPMGGGIVMNDVEYIARRITPVECARLQGMPDDWCSKVPHKDAAEYKLWGNGMALPCILYMMEGAAEVLQRRQLEQLLGG